MKYKKTRFMLIAILFLSTLTITFTANAAKYGNEEQNDWFGEINKSNIFSDLFMPRLVLTEVESNFQSIYTLIKQQKIVQAKERLVIFIKKDPKQANYYFLKALIEVNDKDTAEAKKSLQQAVELGSKNGLVYAGLAKLALDDKKYGQAKTFANKALSFNSKGVYSYKVLADVAMQQQGIYSAEKVLLIAYSKNKGDFKAELEIVKLLGKIYVDTEQPVKLLRLVKGLEVHYPDELSVRTLLVQALLKNKDLAGAEQSLRKILSQHPKDAKYLFLLARILDQQGKEEDILKLLDAAVISLDNPAIVLAYKTNYLIKKKQFNQAFLIANELDRSHPEVSIGKILKGDVYVAEKKYKQALENYQLAYQITPTTKILGGIVKILTIQNKAEAIELLEQALAKNTDNMDIQSMLAGVYQSAGKFDLAIKLYEALLLKQKDNAILLNNLAWAYGQQKNPKALGMSKKAYKKNPKTAGITDTYGYLLLKSGYVKESLDILKQAAELAPKEEEIQLHLAEAYGANHEKELAMEILQQIINANGEGKLVAIKLMEQM